MGSSKKKKSVAKAQRDAGHKEPSAPTEHTYWDSHPRAFYLLTCGPPLTITAATTSVRSTTTWFAVWGLYQYVPLPKSLHTIGGRVLTMFAAWSNLDDDLFPRGENAMGVRLLVACVIGLVMTVAYRNTIRMLDWLVSDLPQRPTGTGEAAPPSGTLGRPSVRVSLLPSEQAKLGRVAKSGRPQGEGDALLDAPPPPNAHGEADFAVKVTLPMGFGSVSHGMGMVYDERRTFQAFVDLEAEAEEAMPTLTRLIATQGAGGGTKAYFAARRDGDHLRIFVDRVLPQPTGW